MNSLSNIGTSLLTIWALSSLAQISTDGTLGPAMELPGPNFTIHEDLGKRAGNNLFHSFQDFNINANESATFTGNLDIQRVISRVTGRNLSHIDGLLKSEIPNADFFFLNPAGFIFGPNAVINISGSFSASTADYLSLIDGKRFYAEPMANEILSIEAPRAYGFLGADIGKITFDQSQLALGTGESFTITGGDIEFEHAQLTIPEGKVTLISVASAGEIQLESAENDPVKINADMFPEFGNITFTEGSKITVSGLKGGAVNVWGNNITLDSATISSDTIGPNQGLGIDMVLSGSLSILRGALIRSGALEAGRGGDIAIQTQALFLDGEMSAIPTGISVLSQSSIAGDTSGDITISAASVEVG